jgi:hypothetical protein
MTLEIHFVSTVRTVKPDLTDQEVKRLVTEYQGYVEGGIPPGGVYECRPDRPKTAFMVNFAQIAWMTLIRSR